MSTLDPRSINVVRFVHAAAIVLLVQLLNPIHAFGQRPGSLKENEFDGAWWLSASSDERIGFLYALDDCLTYDAKPALVFDDTWVNYEKKITEFYRSPSDRRATFVQTIFESFGKSASAHRSMQKSERYGDEFWRSHSELARRGFLDGYFSCRSRYENAPEWSKPLAFYLDSLDDMYNVDDRHGENAPEYTGSVASALDKLRDR